MGDVDLKIDCTACKRRYAWKPELAGKRFRCKCGAPIQFPAALSPEVEDAPPDFDSPEFLQAAESTASMPTKPAPRPAASPAPGARIGAKAGPSPAPSAAAPTKEKLSDRWWALLGLGIVLMAMAFLEFSRLSDLEKHGGSVYLGRFEYLMYLIAGRWGVMLFLLLLSACSIAFGVRKFLKLRRE